MAHSKKEKIIKEIKNNNYPLALTLIDYELENNPDDPELLYNFGVCCSRTGNHKKCISVMESLLEKFPKFIEKDNIYRILIYSYIHLKEFEKALKVINERLKLNVGDPKLHSFKAHILEKTGKISEAIDVHRQILRMNPDYANSLNSLGFLLVSKPKATEKEIQEATEVLKKVLKSSPENPAYLDSFGVLLKKRGNKEAAIQALKKALYYLPSNSEILSHLEDLI
ncbi:MAG: tetratricopeptide repeat protein [Leptospiraceae bacterium]|nr:tetratricopeptide repeat protein [Leptospiraceae bacterium]MCK6381769.1 tetratricopeptide repeat protein [Leptospiraceae bacterium]NUM42786.1 tetratricopeptide repeat protein [Leptospiraceae bacterium]